MIREKAVQRTIFGIVAANLAVEALQHFRRGRLPKIEPLGPGTGRYVFKPSIGGGQALLHLEGTDRVRVLKVVANRKQEARIRFELGTLWDDVEGLDDGR